MKEHLKYFPHEEEYIRFAMKVMKEGVSFTGLEPTDDHDETKAWKSSHKPQKGECFLNAQTFVTAYSEAVYYEGLFVPFAYELPWHHAWIVFKDKVFDFTCEVAKQHDEEEALARIERPLTPVYLGLAVPTDFIAKAIAEQGEGKPVGYLYHCKPGKRRKKSGE